MTTTAIKILMNFFRITIPTLSSYIQGLVIKNYYTITVTELQSKINKYNVVCLFIIMNKIE